MAQDITEYAVMLAVIVVLVIGTIKLISGEKGKGHRQGPAPATSRNPK